MSYDVVVVGAGIGGLTAAALLAARGLNVCLLERQSQVGGCVGRVEFQGFDFDPGRGLYSSFGEGEIYHRLFSELSVALPETKLVESPYVVRLKGETDVRMYRDEREFLDELERAFPECSRAAVEFYQKVGETNEATSTRAEGGFGKGLRKLFSSRGDKHNLDRLRTETAHAYTTKTSSRFQRFLDAQLRAFTQTSLERCDFLSACNALGFPRQKLYSLTGGPATLAESLAQAFKAAGGTLRLDCPVLRLAYDERGTAIGVDLLSGETVQAETIISNLTIWDTHGKLIGLNQIPTEIKTRVNKSASLGMYVLYATIDDQGIARLPGNNLLIANNEPDDDENTSGDFAITVRPENVNGKSAITILTTTEVEPWFSFQSSEEDYEAWDQAALEAVWGKLHVSLPELGSSIEVIETASPRTYYDQTRRRLGRVLGIERTPNSGVLGHQTFLPNLYIVGDTVSSASTLNNVTESAIQLVNHLTK